jgi:hypothetical protein
MLDFDRPAKQNIRNSKASTAAHPEQPVTNAGLPFPPHSQQFFLGQLRPKAWHQHMCFATKDVTIKPTKSGKYALQCTEHSKSRQGCFKVQPLASNKAAAAPCEHGRLLPCHQTLVPIMM